jgi:hypothetical protein
MPRDAAGCLAAIVGAVLVHPVLFFLAFVWGALFGAGEMMSSGPPQTAWGVQGGQRAIANLGFVYEISSGLVPLVASGVGGAVAFGLGLVFRPKSSDQNPAEPSAIVTRKHQHEL